MLIRVPAVVLIIQTTRPKDLTTLETRAEQGDTNAQHSLAVMYGYGANVPQNYAKAVKWSTTAARQGDAPAQFKRGHRYVKGRGVSQDSVYAHMSWNLAATPGNKNAEEKRKTIAKETPLTQRARVQKRTRTCQAPNNKGC